MPRTRDEIDLVLRDRPPVWEYRLFAGLLHVGLQDLDFKWRDYELGITDHAPNELSNDAFTTHLSGLFSPYQH